MQSEEQLDFGSLSLDECDLPHDTSTDSSVLFVNLREHHLTNRRSPGPCDLYCETETEFWQGPCKEKQLRALKYCIELLSRSERPEITSATGDILRL
mmetsp:Transcript_51755/g.161067  ORF Transcript_51755/g.161067 Transcript_51755/m.161067 type:complete len:97 (-) Transcript_51755:1163-1453(-)